MSGGLARAMLWSATRVPCSLLSVSYTLLPPFANGSFNCAHPLAAIPPNPSHDSLLSLFPLPVSLVSWYCANPAVAPFDPRTLPHALSLPQRVCWVALRCSTSTSPTWYTPWRSAPRPSSTTRPPADLFARVYLAFINLALIASVARCEAGHIASREAELWHLNGAPWVDGPEGKGVVKPMDICMSARCKVNCLPAPSAPESCLHRLCWDELRDYQPKRLRLRWVDFGQVLCYCVAYIATLLCWPLDYQLTWVPEFGGAGSDLPKRGGFPFQELQPVLLACCTCPSCCPLDQAAHAPCQPPCSTTQV